MLCEMTAESKTHPHDNDRTKAGREFARQAERLGYQAPQDHDDRTISPEAVEAEFVTSQDPVIKTADGQRLPAVPVHEAIKLNALRDAAVGRPAGSRSPVPEATREGIDGTIHGVRPSGEVSEGSSAPLSQSTPKSRTNPLFPPLPMYGPPSAMRDLQCYLFRTTSFVLSLCFLMVIVMGAAATSIAPLTMRMLDRLKGQNPDMKRPFFHEEEKRKKRRREAERSWQHHATRQKRRSSSSSRSEEVEWQDAAFPPLEGGPDPLLADAAYYARREGLDMEIFKVQTEDGFIIELWHLYDPKEYIPVDEERLAPRSPDASTSWPEEHSSQRATVAGRFKDGRRRYPVLMMHGLLQSSGAFCCSEDKSLAFFLAKSGYDVWLGNNRCGFNPHHTLLSYEDPRMWAWNIRQMGVLDLPALISRVLLETGFEKLGLICHSQGTTQTFVALAKEQRPDIGEKISVFCALAPAVYAGPLIKKAYFKFMRIISPSMFRMLFGIHAFIPFMMMMHKLMPNKAYGWLGYHVFSFLFDWTDERWERDLRSRMFQFAPVYVSAESMRWWLGRECFAKQKCILATRAEGQLEDEEDQEEDKSIRRKSDTMADGSIECRANERHHHHDHGKYAWYDERAPPMAFWIAGADNLVNGRRLMRRFERGREPHVDLVHCKIIEGYEHLDVIWAMDSLEKVGKEVREVIWRTAPKAAKAVCRTPVGCDKAVQRHRSSSSTLIATTAGEWSEELHEHVQPTHDAYKSSPAGDAEKSGSLND